MERVTCVSGEMRRCRLTCHVTTLPGSCSEFETKLPGSFSTFD